MAILLDAIEVRDEEFAQRVRAGVAGQYQYRETIRNNEGDVIPNPETKDQMIARIVYEFLVNSAEAYESTTAQQATAEAKKIEFDEARRTQIIVKG